METDRHGVAHSSEPTQRRPTGAEIVLRVHLHPSWGFSPARGFKEMRIMRGLEADSGAGGEGERGRRCRGETHCVTPCADGAQHCLRAAEECRRAKDMCRASLP